jgi:hypothetical protein
MLVRKEEASATTDVIPVETPGHATARTFGTWSASFRLLSIGGCVIKLPAREVSRVHSQTSLATR